jgi:hypothetical protein
MSRHSGAMMLPPEIPKTPFTWPQAKDLGISRRRLDQLVATHQVRRALTGVYVRADVEDTPLCRVRCAALVVSPFTVVRDRTAAWLLGVDTFAYHELDILPPLETCVLRGHSPTNRPECAGGTRDLSKDDVWTIEGVAVTNPVRTAMDLGCKLPRWHALAALDAFMRMYGITHADMYAELPRYFRRRGVVQLRELIPLADPRAESTGESWTRSAIIDSGLPCPEPQYWVVHDGRELFRLDLAYPHARVVIEYDGREFHTSPEQRENDRLRRKWLRDHGWKVIVVDKDSFTPEALAAWLLELRTYLRLAA